MDSIRQAKPQRNMLAEWGCWSSEMVDGPMSPSEKCLQVFLQALPTDVLKCVFKVNITVLADDHVAKH